MADQPDFLDRVQSGRDAVRKMQQSLARLAMTPEQRQSMIEGMTRLAIPGDQLQAMIDMIDAFGPPLAQIESLRDELAEQRAEVQAIDQRLAHMELATERLAAAAEQLIAFQEPFVRIAEFATGQKATRSKSTTARDTDTDTDPDD